MSKNNWYFKVCYTSEEIINRIGEITKSLCEEFPGLSVSIGNVKDRMYVGDYILPSNFQCLEIDFRYNHTYSYYIIDPHEIFDLDLFEKDLRKRVINEVIHHDDGVKVRFKGE